MTGEGNRGRTQTGPSVGVRALEAAVRAVSRMTRGGIIVNNHTQGAKELRLQIETLGKHLEFISHDELLDRLERPRSRPFCFMTFDDGKRVQYEEAAPELERSGVPAAFYVVTGFISGRHPLWFDLRTAIVRHRSRVPPELDLDVLKTLSYADMMARLAAFTPSAGPDLSDPTVGPMTWDEVRTLSRRGFTIGAHSTDHAILTRERFDEASDDIRRSMARVSDEIGTTCRTFAFPNGNFTPALAAVAERCGARSCLTTIPRWVSRASPALSLPRIQMHNNYDGRRTLLKILAARPGVVLRDPDGSGRSYVKSSAEARLRRGRPR